MNKIRDILNEIKWRKKTKLTKVNIWYIHRGAPNDYKIISGNQVVSIDKTFLKTTDAMIPHHRIFRITYEDETLFEREQSSSSNES